MRVLAALGALLVGVAAALATALLHQLWWALALGALTGAVTLRALSPRWWGRTPFALGWAAVTLYTAVPRPEGDYVVPGNALGYAFLLLAVLWLAVAVLTAPGRPRRADPGDSPVGT